MQVLIVDDDIVSRMLSKTFLKNLGFTEINEALDGEEALNKLNSLNDLGLILLDWNMPRMDGLEFIQSLRSQSEWLDLPVLMMTAENQQTKINEALMAGVSEYIMKPFSLDMLVDKLTILGVTA